MGGKHVKESVSGVAGTGKNRILLGMKRIGRTYPGFAQAIVVLIFMAAAGITGCRATGEPAVALTATAERLEAIATRGVAVMPFDLERTTHIFEKRADGGLQQVIADDATDSEQAALIRAHLGEEAERFGRGDFHDPSMIHGEDMAGLHQLVTGAARMRISYEDLPDGGQILFTTDDPELVAAIHDWFDAQLADHAGHATDHAGHATDR